MGEEVGEEMMGEEMGEEKSRLQGDLIAASQYLKGPIKKMRTKFCNKGWWF